ncbi:MAG TPA: DUF58 domain-containing protein [Candidatus Methylacidiphilales bacterium]|nr:DUF58 domain-containing protein [Candidatus Methylacidiphilales bacterium]
MIVPRLRLIVLASLTLIPFLGMAVSLPPLALPSLSIIGLVVMIAVTDALWGRRKMKGIRVDLPDKLRWIQNRLAKLELIFHTTGAEAFDLRAGLAFPPGMNPVHEELAIQLPAQPGKHYVTCECSPLQRGLFFIEGCFYEIASPFRLWSIRGSNLKPAEVRVYPNLESERKQVATIFLRTHHSGLQPVRQVGQGRDFEKLREYVPGDGYDTIHWKATARRGHPITKVYQIEKTQEIYVIMDASRLSARLQEPGNPSQGTHLDRYIAATLVLGLAAEKQGDLFGLLTFSNSVLSFVRARNGKAHYGACREALYRLEPQTVSPDFEEVASFIRLHLRRRALLIFMTSLDDPILMESFQRAADVMCRKHLMMVHMLQPGNIQPVFSNPNVTVVDEVYQDLAQHLAWHDLRQLALALQQHGVTLLLCSQEKFSAETLSNYLLVKQRQLL